LRRKLLRVKRAKRRRDFAFASNQTQCYY
jgi:hypothetical protein